MDSCARPRAADGERWLRADAGIRTAGACVRAE